MSIRRIAARVAVTAAAGLAVAALAGPAQAAGNGPEGSTASIGSASASTEAKPSPRKQAIGHFTGDGVNIRRSPGGGDILGKGYRGQKVDMICLDYSSMRWMKIRNHATGVTGFVDGKYVQYESGYWSIAC